ncbi:MAG: glycosyltransferase family 4 protein [Tyzzerella sp.]|nr:glycosyltransferase family 4 protein [Tyzzerella sp.]
MKKVLMLTDHHVDMYNWRRELICDLLDRGHEVHIALPYGEKVELLKQMGCIYTPISIERRGKNVVKDACLIRDYYALIKNYKPDVVLTYGTKPNIYGGIVCSILKTAYIENINGLGTGITTDTSFFEMFMQWLYKFSSKNAKCVFFQNSSDQRYCLGKKIVTSYNELLPGSGVNLEYFSALPFPKGEPIVFTYIARIMKEKGIEEFLGAAKQLTVDYPGKAQFHILGFCEESYEKQLEELQNSGIVQYHGMQNDVRPYIMKSHCIVLPSFYGEGMSNTLLESASSGRPIITTNLPGCGETLEDGVTGFVVEPRSTKSLIETLKKFIEMSNDEQSAMGIAGRRKMELEFDRKIVVEKYLNRIEEEE